MSLGRRAFLGTAAASAAAVLAGRFPLPRKAPLRQRTVEGTQSSHPLVICVDLRAPAAGTLYVRLSTRMAASPQVDEERAYEAGHFTWLKRLQPGQYAVHVSDGSRTLGQRELAIDRASEVMFSFGAIEGNGRSPIPVV